MMLQFEFVKANGKVYLTGLDLNRWDYFWGFYRVIKEM